MAAEDLEWERSKISNQDVNLMKKLGLMKKEGAIRFPSEESYPSPPIEYRVSFVDHLIRGLSTPIHDFLRGLLFVYGVQLHQLTPNSILHVAIFITLCECFLGVPPNWALWKRIFCLRRNGSHNAAYNIGGVVICVRSDVEYFDIKFPDSVQGWRKRWLYVHEESANSVEHNIAPFDGNTKILRRRSWDAEATEEEKTATEALMSRIHELQNTRGKELSGYFSPASTHSLPSAVSPRNKRKRDEVDDSGTSKTGAPPAEEVVPTEERTTFNPYEDALVSSYFSIVREDASRVRTSSPSAASSLSSSRQRPSTALVVKMEEDVELPPAPAFKPGDYLDDAELERLLPKLGVEAGFAPGDFVDKRHLDTVVGLEPARRGQGGGVATRRGGAGQDLHRPRQRRRVTRPPTCRRHGTGLR
ncbi:hypothetical protein QYE76_058688 [Lolium multiflorum]|uniref:Transposase (putative) gypsy type domain-containing protein n=1 Tax=Lolium multiflorum TaxID=4521 RepID=A0AAD8T702_LOLMU|nr:hypothetical protein QYE76_058688 [Lolium multiflorum]